MIPRFALVRARTLDQAFAAVDGGDAAFLAGGTELLQVMKMRLAQFGTLVDIKPIDELHGIEARSDGSLRIGAATTHREIERSALVADAAPGLARLASGVANVRVRNTGTIGGNLAFAEPHSDPATFLLACGATVELAGPGGRRRVPVDEFVLGPLTTAREANEILTSIDIPAAAGGEGRTYAKLAFFERPAVSVAVRARLEAGEVRAATVAVGSIGETPAIVPEAGAALVGVPVGDGRDRRFEEALDRARGAFGSVDAVDDLNGSADYKRHLAGVLLDRAAREAVREAIANA